MPQTPAEPTAATGPRATPCDHILLSVLTLDLADQIANIRDVQRAYELVEQLVATDTTDRTHIASLLRILNATLKAEVSAAAALVESARA